MDVKRMNGSAYLKNVLPLRLARSSAQETKVYLPAPSALISFSLRLRRASSGHCQHELPLVSFLHLTCTQSKHLHTQRTKSVSRTISPTFLTFPFPWIISTNFRRHRWRGHHWWHHCVYLQQILFQEANLNFFFLKKSRSCEHRSLFKFWTQVTVSHSIV